MTLKKAIEILSLDLTYSYPAKFNDLQHAIQLGKEALDRIQALRKPPGCPIWTLLPGETKE